MKRFEHGGNLWHHKDPGSWLDFSANINPYGPPSFVINALVQGRVGRVFRDYCGFGFAYQRRNPGYGVGNESPAAQPYLDY